MKYNIGDIVSWLERSYDPDNHMVREYMLITDYQLDIDNPVYLGVGLPLGDPDYWVTIDWLENRATGVQVY